MRPRIARSLSVIVALLTTVPLAAQMDASVPIGPVVDVAIPDARQEPIATRVALAEAEGRAWPRTMAPSSQPLRAETRFLHGPAPRSCVGAFSRGPLRSGEFEIGGQIGGDAVLTGATTAKVWWVPQHPSRGEPLILRAARLDAPADTFRIAIESWASAGPDGHWFYSSGTPLPRAGRWLFVATAGPDWGCFVLESR